MSSSETSSSPPFHWSGQDIAFVATELSREFPHASAEEIAKAVDIAVTRVDAAEGRVNLATAGRQIFRMNDRAGQVPQGAALTN